MEKNSHTCESKEKAEEQLFLFIGGFLAEHLFGNCKAEFPLRFLPCCEGRMNWGKLQAKVWQRERGWCCLLMLLVLKTSL